MPKYFKSSSIPTNYIIIAITLVVFIASLFLPCIITPIQEGLEDPPKIDISVYDRFYLDAIMDDIAINDPKMNSPFSIELLQWVGVGDSYISDALSNMDLSITEKIQKIKDLLNNTKSSAV